MAEEPNGGNAPGFEPGTAIPGGPGEPGSEVPAEKKEETPNPAPGANGENNGGTPAPTTPQEKTPENGGTPNQDPSKQPENGGTPSTDAEKEFQGIIQGWREDREALAEKETENTNLKNEIAQLKNKLSLLGGEENEDEDKEFEGLTREQREQKIIERHQQAEAEKAEKLKKDVEREIAFHERTNREFRENKQAILKIAADFNCTTLDQAMKFWSAQKAVAERAKKAKEEEDKRKRDAGITPGGNNGGAPAPTGYDPARDGKKSIRDIYLGK